MAAPTIYELLMKLRGGGALVADVECSDGELALAETEARLARDQDGYRYVWRPPATVRRRRLR